jgi:serine/threonine protein kinase
VGELIGLFQNLFGKRNMSFLSLPGKTTRLGGLGGLPGAARVQRGVTQEEEESSENDEPTSFIEDDTEEVGSLRVFDSNNATEFVTSPHIPSRMSMNDVSHDEWAAVNDSPEANKSVLGRRTSSTGGRRMSSLLSLGGGKAARVSIRSPILSSGDVSPANRSRSVSASPSPLKGSVIISNTSNENALNHQYQYANGDDGIGSGQEMEMYIDNDNAEQEQYECGGEGGANTYMGSPASVSSVTSTPTLSPLPLMTAKTAGTAITSGVGIEASAAQEVINGSNNSVLVFSGSAMEMEVEDDNKPQMQNQSSPLPHPSSQNNSIFKALGGTARRETVHGGMMNHGIGIGSGNGNNKNSNINNVTVTSVNSTMAPPSTRSAEKLRQARRASMNGPPSNSSNNYDSTMKTTPRSSSSAKRNMTGAKTGVLGRAVITRDGRPTPSTSTLALNNTTAANSFEIAGVTSINDMMNADGSLRPWTIQDFTLGKPLGKGKFGNVYLGRHNHTTSTSISISTSNTTEKKHQQHQQVALKVLFKQPMIAAKCVQNLRREVEIQHRLYHPNIVKLYGYFHETKTVYLVLEYLSGGELYKEFKKAPNGCLTEQITKVYIKQVVDAISHMHHRSVYHRDIKPENLLLSSPTTATASGSGSNNGSEHRLCVGDFGWAVHAPAPHHVRYTLCGTPEYMAPELVRGLQHRNGVGSNNSNSSRRNSSTTSRRSGSSGGGDTGAHERHVDIWSLGILMFELLYGHTPFSGPENQLQLSCAPSESESTKVTTLENWESPSRDSVSVNKNSDDDIDIDSNGILTAEIAATEREYHDNRRSSSRSTSANCDRSSDSGSCSKNTLRGNGSGFASKAELQRQCFKKIVQHRAGHLQFPPSATNTTATSTEDNVSDNHSHISAAAKTLLNALLNPNPNKRPKAEEILTNFRWFQEE